MKVKWFYSLLIFFVGASILMSNSLATTWVIWINQANLSLSSNDSKDPEIAGYSGNLAVVWEEMSVNGDWDIYMSFSTNNGLIWFPAPTNPALLGLMKSIQLLLSPV